MVRRKRGGGSGSFVGLLLWVFVPDILSKGRTLLTWSGYVLGRQRTSEPTATFFMPARLILISGLEYEDDLIDIAGDSENVFSIGDFGALEGGQSVCGVRYPCKSTSCLLPATIQKW